jgi:hypothetical protein
MAVAMRVLDASVETVKPDGRRRVIPIADFHRLPGNTPHIDTNLERDELITAVTLPRPLGGTHIYRKVRDRASYAFALVSVAAVVQRDGSGRIALGGVAHKPWRVEAAEASLPQGARSFARNCWPARGPPTTTPSSCRSRSAPSPPRSRRQGPEHEIRYPATTNPIDQLKVIGKPTDRVDGPLKTTGTAPYAYERHDVAPDAAYGYVVGAGIAKGRIASMDLAAARAAPGVLAIVTARNAGKLGKGNFNTAKLLGGPQIDHYHQALALVVATTFEEARAAAQLVKITYERAPGKFDLQAEKAGAQLPKPTAFAGPPESKVGDFAGAYAAAPCNSTRATRRRTSRTR